MGEPHLKPDKLKLVKNDQTSLTEINLVLVSPVILLLGISRGRLKQAILYTIIFWLLEILDFATVQFARAPVTLHLQGDLCAWLTFIYGSLLAVKSVY